MNATASTCPLCRAQRLERRNAQARCGGCGCRLEFDAEGKLARVAYLPRRFAHWRTALEDRWMTRREMFDAVQRAAAAGDAADGDDAGDAADGDFEEGDANASKSSAGDGRDLLPLVLAIAALIVCLCTATIAVGGLGVYVASTWRQEDVAAAAPAPGAAGTPGAPGAPETTAPGTTVELPLNATGAAPSGDPAQPGEMPPPAEPTQPDAQNQLQPGAAGTAPSADSAPTAPPPMRFATRALRPLPPTAVDPAAPPAPPQPQPLDSSLPTPPPPDLPTVEPTLPPTFTPPPDVPPPTTEIPTVTPTPPVPPPASATPLPTNTPGPGPSATPTYAPGSTRSGDIVLEVSYTDDFIRLTNTGPQPVSLYGMKLRALVPGRPAGDPPLVYDFPNGAVLFINGTCTVYVAGYKPTDQCPFDWSAAAGQLWPDTPGKGVTALLLDAENHEVARFTY